MTVVSDASPLIFLSKLNRLGLISKLLGPDVVVLQCVVDEITLPGGPDELESIRLNEFLKSSRIVDFNEAMFESGRLSASDRKSLTYAIRRQAGYLLADERLMRRIASEQKLPAIGTLGLLTAAVKNGVLRPDKALEDLDRLVSQHGFRISVALYQRFRTEMETA